MKIFCFVALVAIVAVAQKYSMRPNLEGHYAVSMSQRVFDAI